MAFRSPYLNTDQAARYLAMVKPDGTPDRQQLRDYLKNHGVVTKRRGSSILVTEEALEASLRPGPVPVPRYFARRTA